jgi:hypothetical protein
MNNSLEISAKVQGLIKDPALEFVREKSLEQHWLDILHSISRILARCPAGS